LKELQRRVCKAYRAEYTPPLPGSKVGIALQTIGRTPIRAVRLPPTETTCGWYIYACDEWSSEESDRDIAGHQCTMAERWGTTPVGPRPVTALASPLTRPRVGDSR